VIDLLLMLVLMGTYMNFGAEVSKQVAVARFALYWGACIILGLSLPFIALLDALESYVAVRREKREFLETMIQEEVERIEAAKAAKAKSANAVNTVPTPTSDDKTKRD
jgi:hypothetical protein